ncbi:esterase-like activity of phytase family protein [Hyphomicrobium sp.]|uniref:esterase-like activity of phytase family protein n=1 Tax=Hyphomicrobium sp. TaxID=82 RepID=UPI0025C36823|nr:esterase-like activity of phytase family protein [Hyphomicrobium sp.]MCC7251142.1 esterase-like activity of phytase family protein [Hyphomicrobium sp.]
MAGVAAQEIEVHARPIASFARSGGAPLLHRRLAWRGGLVLTSTSPHFGGWSGLTLSRDGKHFVAVSDAGVWMTGALAYDDDSRPQGLSGVRIGGLRTLKGGPLTRMRDRDAEAITLAGGTLAKGTVYIAFEQADRIGVFPLDRNGIGRPTSYLKMPEEAARMRLDGIEALAVLAGGPRRGALVAFAENPLRGEKVHRGWIWLSGVPRGFTIPDLGGYSITDAASLPDGSVLLVERRFRWTEGLKIRLRLLDAVGIKPGGAATGEILLEATNANADIDNLEALAISEDEHGETVITLMSDDNFNRFLQRTMLLQFTLSDEPATEAAATDLPKARSAPSKP